MRRILALGLACGLSLGAAANARAQVAVAVSPWGSAVSYGGYPYTYSSGYYGVGGYGLAPGAAVYSSGYYGVAPAYSYSTYVYPTAYSYGFAPAYRPYGFGYRGWGGPGWRRGWVGGRYGGFW